MKQQSLQPNVTIPKDKTALSFLTLINTWWSIVNAKTQFCANPLAHAIVPGDNTIA